MAASTMAHTLLTIARGLLKKVTLGGAELSNWEMYKFPFASTKGVHFLPLNAYAISEFHSSIASLYHGTFNLTKTGDTYMDMSQFGKGFVFLNGHNLGKYWYIGPQQTLYVPKSWLKVGQNEIVIFDQLKGGHTSIQALDKPILNTVVKAQQ